MEKVDLFWRVSIYGGTGIVCRKASMPEFLFVSLSVLLSNTPASTFRFPKQLLFPFFWRGGGEEGG